MSQESLYLLHFLSTLRYFALFGGVFALGVGIFSLGTYLDFSDKPADCGKKRAFWYAFIACCVLAALCLLAILVIPDYLTLEKMIFLQEASE